MYDTHVHTIPPAGKTVDDYMRMIKINPYALQHIPNPTEEMKLAALREHGLVLEFIKDPTREMQLTALQNTAKAIRFIPHPSDEFLRRAVRKSWTNLAYIDTGMADPRRPGAVRLGHSVCRKPQ